MPSLLLLIAAPEYAPFGKIVLVGWAGCGCCALVESGFVIDLVLGRWGGKTRGVDEK